MGSANVNQPMHSVVRALLCVLTCAACSASEPIRDQLPGDYALVTINGETLQALLAIQGWGTKGAILTIAPDGTYSETIFSKRPPGYEPIEDQVTFHGVWSERDDGTFDFQNMEARQLPLVGTLAGRTLKLRAFNGAERGYQK
jgi:hypothetical protein